MRFAIFVVLVGCGSKPPPAQQPVVGHAGDVGPDPVLKAPPPVDAPPPIDQAAVSAAVDNDIFPKITAYRPTLLHCYKEGLKLDATLSGNVSVQISLDADGKVTRGMSAMTSASTATPAAIDALTKCLDTEVAQWQFGAKPKVMTFKFNLALAN